MSVKVENKRPGDFEGKRVLAYPINGPHRNARFAIHVLKYDKEEDMVFIQHMDSHQELVKNKDWKVEIELKEEKEKPHVSYSWNEDNTKLIKNP